MSKWKQHSVAGLIADGKLVIGDGYRAKNDELTTHGLPFARAGNINCGFQFADADHFPTENISRIGNKVSEPGDVVFTSKGTVGRFALVRDDTRRFVYSPQLCFWRSVDDTLIEPRFLYFWMYGREFFLQYKGVAGQTDMAEYVSLGDQRRMHITLPEISEQRAIASVLGALDDKIELNRRMNETLEALAQSLFKSWFVDATQSALPKGWRAGTLGEVAENPRRGIQPDEIKTDTAYIGLEHMPRRSIALSDWGHTEELESGKFEFKRGEILFGKLRPYFHKVGVAPLDGVCSTDILVITPKEPAWFGFVLGHVSSVELVNHTNAASTGTKMPRANWNDIFRYEVALPPKQLAADFTEKTRPLVERIITTTKNPAPSPRCATRCCRSCCRASCACPPPPNSRRPAHEHALPNPNGIASFSPGLPSPRGYPG